MAELSIIAPTCNPHYIFHGAIKDIALNHSDWQVIIIDDHSEIAVSQYLPDLPNLEIYRNSNNLGAGACRNIGIQKISKKYTLFWDDDDQMH
jgi:glycosyltransferase involved in cell wall biosynthesis